MLFNGAPTAISQRWPGWPCAGLEPGATVVGAAAGLAAVVGAACAGVAGLVVTAVPSSMEPTGLPQTWPGSPCGGFFMPGVPAVAFPGVAV